MKNKNCKHCNNRIAFPAEGCKLAIVRKDCRFEPLPDFSEKVRKMREKKGKDT